MALQRHALGGVAQHLMRGFRIAIETRRSDEAWDHLVQPHAGGRPFDRSGQGEIMLAGARRPVMAHARHAQRPVGAHTDDGAAIVLHPLHEHFARHQERRRHVVGDHRVPAIGRQIAQPRRELPAGIVDQPIDAARPAQHFTDHLLDRAVLAQIAGMGEHVVAAAHFFFDDIELLGGAADQQRPMPLPEPVTSMVWPANRPGRNTER